MDHRAQRDHVVLATKFHNPMGDDPNERGNSRPWILRAVEDSLRRLGTDHINLYQVHRPSSDTDVEETLGALTDLVRQGKVRYLGSSTFPGSRIVEAQWAAHDRRLERFVCEQAPYSALVRGIEPDVLPTAARHGMGVITYSPLAGRHLETQLPAADVVLDPAVLDRIDGIVTPGTVVNPADSSFVNPALEPAARRR